MSIIGKNSLSFRKKDLSSSKDVAIGFKKIVFAHKATAGDSTINLAALVAPSEMSSQGFTNPSTAEITSANIMFYRKNLTLVSSLRGVLVDYLAYTVNSSTSITLNGFTAEDGEIFIGTLDPVAKTDINLVDASAINATGNLGVGQTDFNVGTPFEINKYPLTQIGAVIVYRNGLQQFRNTNNGTTGGNYQEVNAGAGLGTVIRFNTPALLSPDSIMVVSNGLISERPDGSMMAVIEKVSGQLDAVIPTVAALAGVPQTNFQTAPNNVDLKQFGDTVLLNSQKIAALEAPPLVELHLDSGNGHGSIATRIRRFSNIRSNTLSGYATYTDDAANGMSLTINIPGTYEFFYSDFSTSGSGVIGFSLNSSALTTSITTLTYAQGKRAVTSMPVTNGTGSITISMRLSANDVVRVHTDGTPNSTNDNSIFRVIKTGN